ncbi:hypothetical protein CBL_09216 [Carabus blaptoides fortunei]
MGERTVQERNEMIPIEEFGPCVHTTATKSSLSSSFIDDAAPVLLGQLYKKHAYDHYKQLTAAENTSPELQKALMLAVYKGSDLFYSKRATCDKQTKTVNEISA